VTGSATRVDDAAARKIVYDAYTATGATTSNDTLFELWLERALHAKSKERPSWPPLYTKWSADRAARALRLMQRKMSGRPSAIRPRGEPRRRRRDGVRSLVHAAEGCAGARSREPRRGQGRDGEARPRAPARALGPVEVREILFFDRV
jgi:hypothetical protein